MPYGLEGGDTESLSNALMAVASYMAEENLEEAMEGLQYEIEDSFLYGLDEDSIRVMFRELYSNSAFYILSRRCGIDPMEYLEEEHFFGITDFNRLSVLSFLGNASQSACGAYTYGYWENHTKNPNGRTGKNGCRSKLHRL